MQRNATQCTMVRGLREDPPTHTHAPHTTTPTSQGEWGGETSLSPPPLHLSSHISSPSIPGLGGKGNVPKHCNRFALQCNQSALHCSRLAIAALWHRPHCIAIALDCNRIASHCIRFALQLHCIAIALQCVRIPLQSHCVAWQSHCITIALRCNRIVPPPSFVAPGPKRENPPPLPLSSHVSSLLPVGFGKDRGRGRTTAKQCRRIAIAARCVAVALQQHPYCNRPIALQSHKHCNRIAARCNRIALQSHCTALALRCVAVQ